MFDELRNAYHCLVNTESQSRKVRSLAVRSSSIFEDTSNSSRAGMYTSYLNITNFDGLVTSILKCYHNFFSINSGVYSYPIDFSDSLSHDYLSVLVQEFIPADVSGVAFTENPTNSDDSQLVITSNWGLCESIVSGAIIPDTFIVNKFNSKTVQKSISKKYYFSSPSESSTSLLPLPIKKQSKSSLSKYQLAQVVKMSLELEKFFRVSQDIEWSITFDQVIVLQSRPITTVIAEKNSWDLPSIETQCARISICDSWLPEPVSPLFSNTLFPVIVKYWLQGWLGDKTFSFFRKLLPNPTHIILNGYPYFCINFQFSRYPFLTIAMMINVLILYSKSRVVWKNDVFPNYVKIVTEVEFKIKNNDFLANPVEMLEFVDSISCFIGKYWGVIGGLALQWNFWEICFYRYCDLIKKQALLLDSTDKNIFSSGFHKSSTKMETELFEIVSSLVKIPEFKIFISSLDITRLEEKSYRDKAILFLQQFDNLIKKHVLKYDFCIYNLDFSKPTLSDNKIGLIYSIKNIYETMDVSPLAKLKLKRTERLTKIEEIKKLLENYPIQKKIFIFLYKKFAYYSLLRDKASFYFPFGIPTIRKMYLHIGENLKDKHLLSEASDIFYLTKGEIISALEYKEIEPSKNHYCFTISEVVVNRIADHLKQFSIYAPSRLPAQSKLTLWGFDLSHIALMKNTAHNRKILSGSAVSPGKVKGIVCIIRSLNDFPKMTSGKILVAPFITPAWIQLLSYAVAIVTDSGGCLSHASIVSREFGIPAVMGTEFATRKLTDGQVVTVDGTSGIVFLD